MKTSFAREKKVLLYVEDDEDDIFLLKRAIRQLELPYSVVAVRTSQIALAWLINASMSRKLPSLIIMDFNLPVTDGLETMNIIKRVATFRNLPAVFYTTADPDCLLDRIGVRGIPVLRKGNSGWEIRNDARKLVQVMRQRKGSHRGNGKYDEASENKSAGHHPAPPI